MTDNLVWVVLLDRSGSMGEGFSGRPQSYATRSEVTAASVKLDAAKEALVREIRGMSPTTAIAIVAFDDKTELIYEGPAGGDERVVLALRRVSPGAGTNISLALTEVAPFSDSYGRVECLLITDGLAEHESIRAAERLRRINILVNVVLIDPTPQGEAIGRGIAGKGGRYYTVQSAAQLEAGVSRERAYVERDLPARASRPASRSYEPTAPAAAPAASKNLARRIPFPFKLLAAAFFLLGVIFAASAAREPSKKVATGSSSVDSSSLRFAPPGTSSAPINDAAPRK